MRPTCAVLLCGAFAASGVVGLAQQTPQQPPVFRGRTDIVQLDVSVRDKQRRPVRGLTASNFTIRENGTLQEVVTVSEISARDEAVLPVWDYAAGRDVSSNEVGDARMFVILVDGVRAPDLQAPMPGNLLSRGSPYAASAPTLDGIIQIVHAIVDRMRPGDLAAVLGYHCSQPFTEDRATLLNAIDSLRPYGPPCRSIVGVRNPDRIGLAERAHWLIRNLAEYLSVVPERRKAVIIVGTGIEKRVIGTFPPASRRIDLFAEMNETLWLTQLANVTIYAVNPYMLSPERAASRFFDDLRVLSDNTGGFAIADPARFEAGLDQIFVETGSYYMLGYRTTHPEMDGRFRKLSVEVAGDRDVTVRTRSLWFRPKVKRNAPPAAAPVTSKDTSLSLAGLLPDLDVQFHVSAMPFASTTGGGPAVALAAEIAEPVLPGTPRVIQRMNVRVVVYDERGEVRSDTTTEARFDGVPATDDRVRYAVLSRLDLPPGEYSMRLIAQNPGSAKLGSTEFPVVVPDFAREAVSLSGVALFAAAPAPSITYGTLEPLLADPPTALRRFTTSDRVSAFVRVYQAASAQLATVTLTARVLDVAGNPVFAATETLPADRFAAGRFADYRIALPLDRLRVGPYLLTIEAAASAHRTPRRDVRFSIR